ncbi:LuxR C-terminal-related transcriptional regulator [Streptomyces sp. NPDC051664]|uniref:helix-turn-helix transcriptional regulator n=1 Tax=Streptomyces sp. NPDC051664 TaxID=3365668 RepID=UPI0037B57D10
MELTFERRTAVNSRVRLDFPPVAEMSKTGVPAPRADSKSDDCPSKAITLSVLTDDPLTYEGTVSALRDYPEVSILPSGSGGAVDVLLVLAGEVVDQTLAEIERAIDGLSDLHVVLVATDMSEPRLVRAVGLGVVGILQREKATYKDIVQAVVSVSSGHAAVPPALLGPLIRYVRRLERVGPGGRLGLNARETTVLGLLADGLDTTQIARQLNYSERTIKSIIHGIINNLGVSNRTHAVAYVIRAGLL